MLSTEQDYFFMGLALELAQKAANQNEVPVGAILVKEGALFAQGANEVETRKDALAHAEMLAITQAQTRLGDWRLNGTTLYVTKEPCPMCAGALAHVRVDRIVFGLSDPKAGACGTAFNLFDLPGLNHRCQITPDIRSEECKALIQSFFREKRAKREGLPEV